MHFSKILGATALFHFTLFATVSHGHYLNQAANQAAIGRRVDVVIPKGGDGGKGGKGGSSGNSNSGKPAGANPDAGNTNTGQDAGSPGSQGSGNSETSLSSRVSAIIQTAEDDEDTGVDVVLTDDEYKARGVLALQKNQDAISASPRVDKKYNAMGSSYNVEYGPWDQPEGLTDIDTTLGEVELDPTDGWTSVQVLSNGQTNKFKPVFCGYVSNDQRSILATNSYAKYDTNTGANKLPNSEIMFQALMSKGNDPSKLENTIRTPITNKGSVQMMTRAVQAKFGTTSSLDEAYSFTSTDSGFDDLVGDYWTAINGLDNARPQSFMAADHPVALNNLQVTEIIVWPQLSSMSSAGAMIIKMGRK